MTGEKDAEIFYQSSGGTSSNSGSYNFGSISIGAADAKRYLLVFADMQFLLSGSTREIFLDGVTPAYLVGNSTSAQKWHLVAWPTGTSVALTMSASNTMAYASWAIWSVFYVKNTGAYTDYKAFAASPQDINVAKGGVAAAMAARGPLTNASTFTWGGLTKNNEFLTGAGSPRVGYSPASGAFVAAQSPLSVSCAHSSGGTTSVTAISLR
jgi:hypothetical protein